MSATLDLNGLTHTIPADTTETYYQVTDGSASHNGTLVLAAGAILQFDDSTSAGFTSTASAITLTTQGNAADRCYIKSVEDYPNHRWALPVSGITATLTECVLENYTGNIGTAWVTTTAHWESEPDRYIKTTQLTNATGSSYGDAVLLEVIGQASREINARLTRDGIAADITDADLEAACLKKSMANLFLRNIADGTRAGAVSVDGVTSSTDLIALIRELESQAKEIIDGYVKENLPTTRAKYWVSKFNG